MMLDEMLGKVVDKFARRKRVYRWRSSITGKWVSKAFAELNPDTTTREQAR